MNVYLIRHGEYCPSDPQKRLSPQGAAEIRAAALFLKKEGASAAAIWHSPQERAVESAQILQETLNVPIIKEKEHLNPDASPASILNDLQHMSADVILVSHLPFIPHLLKGLFPEKAAGLPFFSTASVAVLSRDAHGWQLGEIFKGGGAS